MGIGPIHLLAIMYFFIIIFTPRCPNVCFFYGPIVPEINYSSSSITLEMVAIL